MKVWESLVGPDGSLRSISEMVVMVVLVKRGANPPGDRLLRAHVTCPPGVTMTTDRGVRRHVGFSLIRKTARASHAGPSAWGGPKLPKTRGGRDARMQRDDEGPPFLPKRRWRFGVLLHTRSGAEPRTCGRTSAWRTTTPCRPRSGRSHAAWAGSLGTRCPRRAGLRARRDGRVGEQRTAQPSTGHPVWGLPGCDQGR